MTQYAESTSVTADKSRAEIEATLRRYGAGGFMYGWQAEVAMIAFEMMGRRIRFDLKMPNYDDFSKTPNNKQKRKPAAQAKAYEQACRQRWRALALVIKAKLEAVETGITTFEESFMSHIVLPSGVTVGRWMLPQIKKAYEEGAMPPLLPNKSDAL